MTERDLSADCDRIVALGNSASLDRSPKKNWIERSGGELPAYVREVARSIEKTGKSLSQSIAIAISRIKVWAATGEGDTKAKAAKALAEWTALKAKAGKNNIVAASHNGEDVEYVFLSNTKSFNTEIVKRSFNDMQEEKRKRHKEDYRWCYIEEVWTEFVIFSESPDKLYKVTYTVEAGTNEITWGEPVLVEKKYVAVQPSYAALSRIQEAAVGLTRGNDRKKKS